MAPPRYAAAALLLAMLCCLPAVTLARLPRYNTNNCGYYFFIIITTISE